MWVSFMLSQYKVASLADEVFMSASKWTSNYISQVAATKARYSTLKEDLDTINYFFVRQKINDFPKKKHWPEIDLLISSHSTQSACENPMRWREMSCGKNKAWAGLCFKCRRTLVAALKYWSGLWKIY